MKYVCVRQHDITDCGAACISTICKYYGLNLPITKIGEIAGTDDKGTSIFGIVKAAEELGFVAKAIKGKKQAIFAKFSLPAIALVILDGHLSHYVVIYKVTNRNVIVADPGKGFVRYTAEEFCKIWTGTLIVMIPGEDFKQGKQKQTTLSRFFKLLLPQKKLLLFIWFLSLFITVLGIGTSFYFTLIIDYIAPNSLIDVLNQVSIGVVVLYIIKSLLDYCRTHMMIVLNQKLDIPLMMDYYHHVIDMPMSFFSSRKTGEIISRFVDASKIRDAISRAAITVMIDLSMAIISAYVLCRQNIVLFRVSLVILIMYCIIMMLFKRPIRKNNEKQMEDNAQLNSYLVESLNGIETIKTFTAEESVKEKVLQFLKKYIQGSGYAGRLANGQQSLTSTLHIIGETIIIWIGTISVIEGQFTIGELMTFNAVLLYFLNPIKNLIDLQPTIQTAIVAAERLGEILDLELEESQKAMHDILSIGRITISNLYFRYGRRQLVLKGINMIIEKGEKIALVGKSGSGKTTLVKLLMRFYNYEQGTIQLDNQDIMNIGIKSLRKHIAYVSQNIFLFYGTIKQNLVMENKEISFDEMVEVCDICKVQEFVNKLPMGYDTVLEENGANLSGGQRQRIAIARALLKHPDILVLDEATSNLDSLTEKAIKEVMKRMEGKMTIILIAHRLNTIMHCDKIYVLENGEVVECGRHEDLLHNKNHYFNMWNEQYRIMKDKDLII